MRQWHFERPMGLFPLMLAAAFLGGIMVLLAVRYTGLGDALVVPPPQVQPAPQTQPAPAPTPAAMPQLPAKITDFEAATTRVVQTVGPAVVMITTTRLVEVNDFFLGSGYREVPALGSGVIFRKDGYILTNNHVISQAEKIIVVLPDGRTAGGRLIGSDPFTDLAVVKIDLKNLPAARLGDSDKLRVGQLAVAIGNPLEESLSNTVTVGVVSALGRSLRVTEGVPLRGLIQTDASINPGNSGGPLLDSDGRVVGINTAIIQEAQGIGFAIPINTAKSVASQLIQEGRVRRGGIGVKYIPFDRHIRPLAERRFRINLPVDQGLLITEVNAGGPAEKAGLKPGDVLVKVAGWEVSPQRDIREIMATMRIGQRVKVEFYRGEERLQTRVTVSELK